MTDPSMQPASRDRQVRGIDLQTMLAQAYLEIGHLQTALSSARQIGAAIGIIMATKHLSYDDAFTELGQASQLNDVQIHDLAQKVMCTGTL